MQGKSAVIDKKPDKFKKDKKSKEKSKIMEISDTNRLVIFYLYLIQ
jgi:hypothetical protein